MADTNYTLNGVSNSDTNMTGSIQLTQKTGTIIKLDTDHKYLTKDIWLSMSVQDGGSPTFQGGALTGTATASGNACTLSDTTNNSGVSITTACTVTRAAITYGNAVSGWVSKASGDSACASDTGTMTAKTYYINGVTLATPSSGTNSFTITIPNGDSTITLTFTVDSNGNTVIT